MGPVTCVGMPSFLLKAFSDVGCFTFLGRVKMQEDNINRQELAREMVLVVEPGTSSVSGFWHGLANCTATPVLLSLSLFLFCS